MTFARLPDKVIGKLALVLLLGLLLAAGGLPASGAVLYAATYAVPSAPATLGGGSAAAIQVTVTNTGSATWNATGANPVNLAYHWYDALGKVVHWDGARTGLPGNVAPSGSATVNAAVSAPTTPGAYQLRFALVKEGVTWFEPEPAPHAVTVVAAYSASFGAVTLARLVAGGTYTLNVPVTNAGTVTWNAAGANPVNLSYHWLDLAGRGVIWDGVRTSLGTDLAPGGSRTVAATVVAPSSSGSYTLALDLVREGAFWFGSGSRVAAVVDAPTYRASYAVGASSNAFIGESRTLPVTVTNLGNVPWSSLGTNPVNLSYHWYDQAGTGLVSWDGVRTAFPSVVAPGASATVQTTVVMPLKAGVYTLRIDLVREGLGWFSSLGSAPASVTYAVASGFGVGWVSDDSPASITNGSGFPVNVTVQNSGQRTWPAGGATPVRLSYHVYNSAGALVIWDGVRGILPRDVASGETVTISIAPIAPSTTGTYTIKWDMVQDGVAWFSSYGIATRASALQVFPGVTIYGRGWGHGVGLSQWGAQGWATGAAGAPLTGEQIIQKYFPGVAFSPVPTKPVHVLLSSPSTGCNGRTVSSIAQMRSDGGIRVVKWYSPSQVLMTAVGTQTVRVFMNGSTLQVMDEWSKKVVYSGSETIGLVPVDPSRPITVDQKLRFYRGLLAFEPIGFQALRVVNEVGWDDYARGSVPTEMLIGWHIEAYKAQSYAAKSYAAWRQSTNTSRLWDVRDDTTDQCYGGASVETTAVNSAVAATAGRTLTYNGGPVKTYYSSSAGGSTEPNGCVWNIVRNASGQYTCGTSDPYLSAVKDPADLAAVGPSGPNPHRSWTVTFQSWQIENAVARAGHNIGTFVSLDLSNVGPGGHVVSVRVRGTAGTVELPGDNFLRSKLNLKSTMVRTGPF